ncbi:TPA: hypothetical protein NKQ26_004591 [Vibrio parahaemolyticus]|nr:hypothetical protein [Vibrio parahaemolyticus]KOE94943.1 hypothetical protein ACS88_12890 [Vibrio parahaemolyticus]MBE3949004.1 hypothetical protein [Vibrio parahaemolyticus]MBE4540057.1 hypothetical protein [Vibrio parahaemolyticus]MCI9726033.1 hypothetical protein [Vibrio parahaemolyticus]
MFLLLILPVLVSGFLVCHIHPYYRYKLHRYEGQYLYLKSANLGMVCFFIALILVLGLNKFASSLSFLLDLPPVKWLPEQLLATTPYKFVIDLLCDLKAFTKQEMIDLTWITIITVLMLLLPLVWSMFAYVKYCVRYWTLRPKEQLNAKVLSDSPLDDFLFKASLEKGDKLVMMSLSDRKVYVGKVLSLGEPNESEGLDQEVTIKPVMSGYRDKDTLKVTFTTHYSGLDENTVTIVKQDLISSACEFSFSTYEKLNPKKSVYENLSSKIKKLL